MMVDEKIQFSFDFPEQDESSNQFNPTGMFFIIFKSK